MSQPTVAAGRGDRVRIVLETTLRLDATATSGRVYIEGEHGATYSLPAAQIVESSVIKHDEPTGLGAVVEDVDGFIWVRLCADVWACSNVATKTATTWETIPVARVLSEGVPA